MIVLLRKVYDKNGLAFTGGKGSFSERKRSFYNKYKVSGLNACDY